MQHSGIVSEMHCNPETAREESSMPLQKDRKEERWERKGLEREREEIAVFEAAELLLRLADGHLTVHVSIHTPHCVPQ